MESDKKIIVATHNGSFHTDDVFAVASLSLAFSNEGLQVVRTRDQEVIKSADIVVDVGRIHDVDKNRFDHHQEGGAGKRDSGIPYASFGLVWRTFGEKICSREEAEIIDKGLVSFVDAVDSGVDLFENKTQIGNYSVSSLIGAFNSTSLEEDKNDEIFIYVVDIAKEIIKREIASAKEFVFGKTKIEEALRKVSDRRLIVLEEKIDKRIIHDVLQKEKDVLFVVHPYTGVGWALRAVRKDPSSFESRLPLPSSWAGKEAEELQKITGVSDAIFCHNARFIANAMTKKGVLALAKIALES